MPRRSCARPDGGLRRLRDRRRRGSGSCSAAPATATNARGQENVGHDHVGPGNRTRDFDDKPDNGENPRELRRTARSADRSGDHQPRNRCDKASKVVRGRVGKIAASLDQCTKPLEKRRHLSACPFDFDEAYRDRQRNGWINLSTQVTKMPRSTRRVAARELAKLGLITLEAREGTRVLRAKARASYYDSTKR